MGTRFISLFFKQVFQIVIFDSDQREKEQKREREREGQRRNETKKRVKNNKVEDEARKRVGVEENL